MLTEADKKFAKIAVDMGLVTGKQVEETIIIQNKLLEFGIEKELSGVLLDKKYLTAKQIRKVELVLEYERLQEEEVPLGKLLIHSGVITKKQLQALQQLQKQLIMKRHKIISLEQLILEKGILTKENLALFKLKAATKLYQKKRKFPCNRCKKDVIPVDYRCPHCGEIVQLEFQEMDLPEQKSKTWWLYFYHPSAQRKIEVEAEYQKIKDWILSGLVTTQAQAKEDPHHNYQVITSFKCFNVLFEIYAEMQRRQRARQRLKLLKFYAAPAVVLLCLLSYGVYLLLRPGPEEVVIEDIATKPDGGQSVKRLIRYEGRLLKAQELVAKLTRQYGPPLRFEYENKYISAFVLETGDFGAKVYVIAGDSAICHQKLTVSRAVYQRARWRAEFYQRRKALAQQTKQLVRADKLEQHFDLARWAQKHGLYHEMRQELLICYQLDPHNPKVQRSLRFLLPEEQVRSGSQTEELSTTQHLQFFAQPHNFFMIQQDRQIYQPQAANLATHLKSLQNRCVFTPWPPTELKAPAWHYHSHLLATLPDPEIPNIMQGQSLYLGSWYHNAQLQQWRSRATLPKIVQGSKCTLYSAIPEINNELTHFLQRQFTSLLQYAEKPFQTITRCHQKRSRTYHWHLLLACRQQDLDRLQPYLPPKDKKHLVLRIYWPDPAHLELVLYPLLQALSHTLFSLYLPTDIPWARTGMAQMLALGYPEQAYQQILFWDDAFAKIVLARILAQQSIFDNFSKLDKATLKDPVALWALFDFLYHNYSESLALYFKQHRQGHPVYFVDYFAPLLKERQSWQSYSFDQITKILQRTAQLEELLPAHLVFFRQCAQNLLANGSLKQWQLNLLTRFQQSWAGLAQRIPAVLEARFYLARLCETRGRYQTARTYYRQLLKLYKNWKQPATVKICQFLKQHLKRMGFSD